MRLRRTLKATVSVIAAGALLALGGVALGPSPAAADVAQPGPPTGLQAVDVQPESVTVEWETLDGAYEYIVGINGRASAVTRNVTWTFTNLVWDQEYEVTVRAWVPSAYPNDYTDWSDPIRVVTPIPDGFQVPSAPTDLRPERDAQGEVATIRWDASAEGYGRLTYRLHAQGVGVVATASGSDLSADVFQMAFIECVVLPGETYTFWVTATDRAGNVSPPSDELTVTLPPWSWI